MEIKFDKNTAVSGVLSVKMCEGDYATEVKKQLRNFCEKANMPGFRKGHVPMGLAQKMYGAQAKAEAVNNLLGRSINDYIKNEKLNILGEPLENEQQTPQDIENGSDFEFYFDIALAPEMKVELTSKDKVPYYDITVSDEMVQNQVDDFCQRAGQNVNVEEYQERDIVRGVLGAVEGDKTVEKASVMPTYFKNDEAKKAFEGAKVNDVITFDPWVAYDGNETEIASLLHVKKEELEGLKGEYRLQIEEISRYQASEVNQELFDKIYGEGACKDEAEFRAKIKEGMQQQLVADSDYRFFIDVRELLEKQQEKAEMPEALLRRMMERNAKESENYNAEKFEEEFAQGVKYLKWQLIREQLAEQNKIKIENGDVQNAAKEAARYQFMQYGLNNIPDEYLENYAKETLKNKEQVNQLIEHVMTQKLIQALKNVVALEHKSISMEDFGKLSEKK